MDETIKMTRRDLERIKGEARIAGGLAEHKDFQAWLYDPEHGVDFIDSWSSRRVTQLKLERSKLAKGKV